MMPSGGWGCFTWVCVRHILKTESNDWSPPNPSGDTYCPNEQMGFLEVFLMGKRQCRKGAHRCCPHRHAVWRSLAGADAFGLRGPGLLVLLWGKGLFPKVRGQTVAPTLRHP